MKQKKLYYVVIGLTIGTLIIHHFYSDPISYAQYVKVFAQWQITKYTHLKIQKYGNFEYLATKVFGFLWTKVFNMILFFKF